MYKKILWLLPFLLLSACHKPAKSTEQLVPVVRESMDKPLYFSGTLQPLKIINVPSPADGFVTQKNFEYGQTVKEGDVIVTINSDQLQKEYSAALTTYLKSKQELATSKSKLHSDSELLRLGIIAKESFEQTKSAYDSDQVAFLQAANAVKEVLKNGGGDFSKIEKLDITNIGEVNKALNVSYAQIKVKALGSGVALSPPQTAQDDKKVMIGSKVETGQVLLAIGDLSGFSAAINVSENDIDKVTAGAKVEVTGSAFPNQVLSGIVQSVDAQAKQDSSSQNGIPQFAAKVIMPNIKPELLAQVRVGMSAKIEIKLNEDAKLMVPISAVHETGNQHWVMKKNNGKMEKIPVVTGSAGEEKVQILSGLAEGDQVLVDDVDKA